MAMVLAWIFYLRLSVTLFFGFIPVGLFMLIGVNAIASEGYRVWLVSLIIFSVAWISQFWGHKIEGKKPSFFSGFAVFTYRASLVAELYLPEMECEDLIS